MGYLCRKPSLIMRREKNGGLVYNFDNGTTIEVDKHAYRFLELLDGTKSPNEICFQINNEFIEAVNPQDLIKVISTLLEYEFISWKAYTLDKRVCPPIEPWVEGINLSAPEKVHLMLTRECNLSCKGCYAKNVKKPELTTDQIKELIKDLSNMKVFQLALGGGEPLLFTDLAEITKYANQNKLLTNITTNGTLLTNELAIKLRPYIGKLQFSLVAPTMKINDKYRSKGAWKAFLNGCRVARNNKLKFGVNVLVTNKTLVLLPQLIKFILDQGTTEINILRPKPTKTQLNWFIENQLETTELQILQTMLVDLQQEYPELNLSVDCALTLLMDQLSEDFRQEHGIFGCTAGTRFLTIHSNGDVYPCSFLDQDSNLIGNIHVETIKEIWEKCNDLIPRLNYGENQQSPKNKFKESCSVIYSYSSKLFL